MQNMWPWSSKGKVNPSWKITSLDWILSEHYQSCDQNPHQFYWEKIKCFITKEFNSHRSGLLWYTNITPKTLYRAYQDLLFPKRKALVPCFLHQGMQHEIKKIKETNLFTRLFCSASARSIDLTIFVFPNKLSKWFYKKQKILIPILQIPQYTLHRCTG